MVTPLISAAELDELRADAEALMADTFEMRDYGDGYHYDADLGQDVHDFDLLYTTIGRVLTNTAASQVEAGGRTVVVIDQTLHVPAAKPTVAPGVVAHRTSDGAEFTVLADVTHPQPKSRKFSVRRELT